jgi:hypothetical protein
MQARMSQQKKYVPVNPPKAQNANKNKKELNQKGGDMEGMIYGYVPPAQKTDPSREEKLKALHSHADEHGNSYPRLQKQ